MTRRKIPTVWLITDERGGDPVALARALPKGSGVVFRHHATPKRERRALFRRVRQVTRQRRLVLLLAGPPTQARAWGADGAHHRSALKSCGLRSAAAHNRREMVIARRTKADLTFVSPVFATRSHPGARPLGVARFGLLVGSQRQRAIALGGMNAAKFERLSGMKAHGWAAIDAFK
jgi:thiamine-phosphate pyrophosphorylase